MGKETLVIKHRSVILGETSYIYEFYKKTSMGLFIKKLDESDLTMIVRYPDRKDDLQMLSTKHPTWVNETTIILHTIEGDTTITLD